MATRRRSLHMSSAIKKVGDIFGKLMREVSICSTKPFRYERSSFRHAPRLLDQLGPLVAK